MARFEDIIIEHEGAVGVVTLNRPERANTLRPQTMREVCEAVDAFAADDGVRAIVIRAEGKHFCSGADYEVLEKLTATPPAGIRDEIYTHFQGAVRRVYQCPKPTVALVQGAAVTVGCELALACDFRVVADNASFQESWIRLGLMPPLGGTFILPRMIGMARASEMCLRGKAVKAEEAVALGMANECVAIDKLKERGLEIAAELAAAPPLGYAATKEALRRGLSSTIEAEWSANVGQQAILISSEDFKEGLAAVKGKRKPQFKGR